MVSVLDNKGENLLKRVGTIRLALAHTHAHSSVYHPGEKPGPEIFVTYRSSRFIAVKFVCRNDVTGYAMAANFDTWEVHGLAVVCVAERVYAETDMDFQGFSAMLS